jgi:hypothetical protein
MEGLERGKRPFESREPTLEETTMKATLKAVQQNWQSFDLACARSNADDARVRCESATTDRTKREAAENLEFWTNRAAFLSSAK